MAGSRYLFFRKESPLRTRHFACGIDPVCERGREQQIFRYILTLKGTSMRIVPWRVSAFFTFAVCMSVCAASLQAQTWSAPQLVENGGGAAVSVNANGTAAYPIP